MVELVGNIPDDVVLQAQLDILYGQTPDITIKAHELPEESEPTVEKSGTLAEPIFDIGIPQAMGAVAAREYAKQAETARDAAILAGETAKDELNGIVASADDALDQKIAETGTLLDEKVATAAQRASEAASSAVAAAQKATAAEQAMQGAQAAQAQAEQSAQEAAENTAMAKDFASGQPVTYSGSPVSIAYAGAQRIASITAYGETPQGGTTEAPVALTGISSVTVNDDVTELPIPRPLHKVGDVRDVCRTRVKSVYDKRIVLDGTENWNISSSKPNSFLTPVSERIVNGLSDSYPTLKSPEIGTKNGIYLNYTADIIVTDLACSTVEEFKAHLSAHPLTVYYRSTAYDGTNGLDVCLTEYQTGYIESYADESITTAWISSTGALSTGAEVAYVLSSPETYATDPLDIDNAAGTLTVMTGGEVEVRMTELIGSRSDVSNNTVAFTETAQDADIASGEKLSVLFGKIKKRFSVVNKLVNGAVYPNLLDNSDFTNPVNQRGLTSYSGGGTYCIDRWDIASTATVAVVSDGIKITATTLSGIRQKIENITDGQLLVFQLCDNADTVYTQAFAASTTQAEYTTDFGKFRFVLNSGGVLTISILLNAGERTFKWAKLEKGSVATPYVPKGYGAELAECLRYFQRVHADWRIYPTLKDMLYRFSQSTLQVMRIKPTISAHGTPYTFGCTINALDAQPMAFTVETKITEQGQNSAAASMLGYFDLSADL